MDIIEKIADDCETEFVKDIMKEERPNLDRHPQKHERSVQNAKNQGPYRNRKAQEKRVNRMAEKPEEITEIPEPIEVQIETDSIPPIAEDESPPGIRVMPPSGGHGSAKSDPGSNLTMELNGDESDAAPKTEEVFFKKKGKSGRKAKLRFGGNDNK